MDINQINTKILDLHQEWENCKGEFVKKSNLNLLTKKLDNLESLVAGSHLLGDKNHDFRQLQEFIKSDSELKLETKALTSQDIDQADFKVSMNLWDKLNKGVKEQSAIRQLANVVAITTNSLDLLIEKDKFTYGWVSEDADRPETKTASFIKKRIFVHEVYSQPMVTQRLLDDTSYKIAEWLLNSLQKNFAAAENRSFIHGDGVTQPRGLLHKPEENLDSIIDAENTNISFDLILKMINSLEERYLNNATFLMHRSTLSQIQSIKDSNGRFIWQSKVSDPIPDTIFGIPVVCCQEMPTLLKQKDKTITYPILLADFKAAYTIVDRENITLSKDPYTQKPFVKFYTVRRVGGDIVDASAMKLLKMKAN